MAISKLLKPSTESQEQIALFQWVNLNLHKYPLLELLYHIPNGGKRDIGTAKKLKAEGVKAGVPDLCLPVARGGYNGLYIELKAGKNKPTALQCEWIEGLSKQGYCVAVCWGWEDCIKVIVDYLK